MHIHIQRLTGALCASSAVLSIIGCQSYEPKPLDLEAHKNAWRLRTPGDESVRTFVDSLDADAEPAAEAFDPADGLSLEEAELVALIYNPDLRLARLRAGIAEATAQHAGRWEDPEFSIDVLRITESVSNPWFISPGLAITIPVSGRLDAEKSLADARSASALEAIAESEWRIRTEVRTAWAEWSATRFLLKAQENLLDSVSSLADAAGQLAESGEMMRTEAALFAIERAQRESEVASTHGALREQEFTLRALLGLAPDAPVEFLPSINASTDDPQANALDSASQRNLTLARLRADYEAAENALRLEIRKQYPDLTLGPLYESDQGESRIGFLGAIPIPILNANRQGIAQAEARREFARAEFETHFERLANTLSSVQARLDALGTERTNLEDELVPLVDRQLEDARELLALGEGGGLVLLESLSRAQSAKQRLIEVRLEQASAAAQLQFLIGPEIRPTGEEN